MKHNIFKSTLRLVLVLLAPLVMAGEPVNDEQLAKLRKALEVPGMQLKVASAHSSEIPGLYEVQFASGPLVYSTLQGEFFIVGDLYTVNQAGFVNLTEKRRDGLRKEQLAKVKLDDMIVFSPEGKARAHISVFFDDTCFYCQKLHQEVPQLNKNGVEVRYLAYPRAGINSDAFKQLASAWCADNKQETLTKLVNKQSVPVNVCKDNPIAAQFEVGQQLGVQGTPAIITESGQLIPGYQSAEEMMVTLGLNKPVPAPAAPAK